MAAKWKDDVKEFFPSVEIRWMEETKALWSSYFASATRSTFYSSEATGKRTGAERQSLEKVTNWHPLFLYAWRRECETFKTKSANIIMHENEIPAA